MMDVLLRSEIFLLVFQCLDSRKQVCLFWVCKSWTKALNSNSYYWVDRCMGKFRCDRCIAIAHRFSQYHDFGDDTEYWKHVCKTLVTCSKIRRQRRLLFSVRTMEGNRAYSKRLHSNQMSGNMSSHLLDAFCALQWRDLLNGNTRLNQTCCGGHWTCKFPPMERIVRMKPWWPLVLRHTSTKLQGHSKEMLHLLVDMLTVVQEDSQTLPSNCLWFTSQLSTTRSIEFRQIIAVVNVNSLLGKIWCCACGGCCLAEQARPFSMARFVFSSVISIIS